MNSTITYKPETVHQLSEVDLGKISQGLIARMDINNFEKLITSNSNNMLLLDKVGKSIVIDAGFMSIAPFIHSSPMVFGKYIEEGNLRHQKPIKFTGEHDNLTKALPSPIPVAITTPGERYYFKTTFESQQYNTAGVTAQQVASYSMLQMKRHVDNQILFLNFQIKEFIGQTLGNVIEKYNSAQLFDPFKNYDLLTVKKEGVKDLTYVKDGDDALGIVVKPITAGTFPSFVSATGYNSEDSGYDVERGSIIPIFLKTETNCPGTGETEAEKNTNAATFLLDMCQTIQSLAQDSSAYNPAGQITSKVTLKNMFMVMEAGIIPYIQLYLANVIHTEKVESFLSIPIITFDTLGSVNKGDIDIIGGLIDNRGIKVIPNYYLNNKQGSASGDYVNYYTHTQNTFWRSFITNINVIISKTGMPKKRLLNKYLYYKDSDLLAKEIAELKIHANKIQEETTKSKILGELDAADSFAKTKEIFNEIKAALEA